MRAPVAFVLSGGASLGAAQVGMLRALREAAIEPDLLVGTSVGALNAAVCAADPGGCGERLERRWLSMRGLQVFPVNPARLLRSVTAWTSGGLVSPSGLARICREHLHATTFANLAVPLLVVATDQLDGTAVVLDGGSVLEAVMASSAIPGVFPAVSLAGRTLVDGALSANVATLQAVAAGARTVVVLEASGPCRLTRPPRGVVEQVLAAVHVLTRSQAAAQAEQAAEEALVLYLPTPCTTRTSPLDFGGSADLIAAAYELSRDFLAGLPPEPPVTGLVGEPHRHPARAHAHARAEARS
ncbi:MAG: patatin-like phospholipase family protein [Intrasporangiaceae bacterium]|nr:patatin-like phospholipase family protein [Intrasporangiaceae bacterium]